MKLEDMELFIHVVEQGSITAASDFTGLPKSTVSRHIRALEEGLGARLLDRTTRRMRLTPTGEKFLDQAREILQSVADIEHNIATEQRQAEGLVSILCTEPLASRFTGLLKDFLLEHPKMRFEVYAQNTVSRNVPQRRFDLMVQMGEPEDSSLIAKRVGVASVDYYASPAYLASFGEPVEPEDLAEHRLIFRTRREDAPRIWPFIRDGKAFDIPVNPVLATDSFDIALEAACDGVGIVRMNTLLAKRALNQGKLVPLFDGDFAHKTPIYVLYPSRQHIPRRLQVLLDYLDQHMASALVEKEQA
jgi:DNA-binding transcriptional LysR family regulator